MGLLSRMAALAMALALTAGMAGAQEKPRIVAVNAALEYLTERLVGDRADVVFPVPEGVDPSFWRPSIADISAVQAADLIVLNGAGFATWTAKVSLPRSKLVDTSRGLDERLIATETITHAHGDGGEHSHEGTASYTWLDPMMARAQAEAIAAAIKARGLVDAARVDENLAALSSELTALDAAARADLADASQTVFVATHPRYQYLARAYGLTLVSVEWEAGAMPNAAQLDDLRALVDETEASVLIWEAEPPADARTTVADLGLQDVVFPPMATSIGDEDFLELFTRAVQSMADAAARAESG